MRKCSTLLAVEAMKTKITSRYGLILVRRVTTSIGEKLKESSPRVGSGLTPCYLLTASELTHHCSLMACKLTHLATMETGREILPPPKCIQYMAHSLCSPKTPHQHVTDTSNTSVNSQQLSNKPTQASNSRGMNKKTWPVHNGTFQPQRTTKSGSLWYNVCDWR